MATTISLTIKTVKDSYQVSIEPESTILALKQAVEKASTIPPDEQRLIYAGHILKDEETVQKYDIKDGHTVHLVRRAASAPAPASSAAASTQAAPRPPPTAAPASSTPAASTAPTAPAAGASPFGAGFGPGMGAFGGGGFGGMGMGMGNFQSMQQEMMNNPDMMAQMLDSPIMQSFLSNPELVRMAMQSDPQMRDVMERNPEMARLLADPQVIRQSLEMMRNPGLMREMMRTNDRAMANLENHPEGFSALRRVFTDIQEPLMNASAAQSQAALDRREAENPFGALAAGSSNDPIANPWAPRTTAAAAPSSTPAAPSASQSATPAAAPGAMPSPFGDPTAVMSQMLQNPAVSQMMQQLLSDPNTINMILQNNPYVAANPQLAAQLRDPNYIQQMLNPQNLQAMVQLQQAVQQLSSSGLIPSPAGMLGGGGLGGAPGANPPGNFDMSAIFSAMQGGLGGAPAAQQDTQPPAERYARQLEQLRDMGFYDTEQCIAALQATNGNVNAAVDRLLQ